jgi:hypothetical protein
MGHGRPCPNLDPTAFIDRQCAEMRDELAALDPSLPTPPDWT